MSRRSRTPSMVLALTLVALLFALAALMVLVWAFPPPQGGEAAVASPSLLLAMALMFMSGACSSTVLAYRAQVRHPKRAMPWLNLWRGQLAMALALAVLPACLIAIVLLSAPGSPLYVAIWPLWGLSTVTFLSAAVWGYIRNAF